MDDTVSIPTWLIIFWFINFAISFWNARVVGKMWVESKVMGGFARLIAWSGAVMSACGFIWCYAIIEAYLGHAFFPSKVTPEVMNGLFAASYLAIIFPVLGSGFAITAQSLYAAWKRRDFTSMSVAAWNTFAQIHNTYQAFQGVPQAWSIIGDLIGGKNRKGDSKSGGVVIMLLLLVLAIILGILTTTAIIMKYAGTRPLPEGLERAAQKERTTASRRRQIA